MMRCDLVQDVTEGIYRDTIQKNLVVKVRAGASSGASYLSDHLPPLDMLSFPHTELMQMAIARHEVISVVDGNHPSKVTLSAREHHQSICGGNDRCPNSGCDIESLVKFP